MPFGDISCARELPEENSVADATICLYILRYHTRENRLKIFRELLRVTKPGGYIFTEGFFLKRTEAGVRALSPTSEPAISFYDSRKALYYLSDGVEKEVICPVADISDLERAIVELSE